MENKNTQNVVINTAADVNAQTAALVKAMDSMTLTDRLTTLLRVNPVTGKPALFYVKSSEWTSGNKEASASLKKELLHVNVALVAALNAHGTPQERPRREGLERAVSHFYDYAASVSAPTVKAENYRADVRYIIRYAVANKKLDADGNISSTVISSSALFNLLQLCMYIHVSGIAFPGVTLNASDSTALVKLAEKEAKEAAAKKESKPAAANGKKNRGKKDSKPAPAAETESKPAAPAAAPAPAEKAAG